MAHKDTFDEFNPSVEDFDCYAERLKMYFEAHDVPAEKHKSLFLSVVGGKHYSLLKSLCSPEAPSSKTFAQLVEILKSHLSPKPLTIGERLKFHKRCQASSESVNDFAAELRRLAFTCDFGQFLQEALRDRFVCGLSNTAFQRKLLSDADLTFTKAVEIAVAMEAAATHSAALQATPSAPEPHEINKVNRKSVPSDQFQHKVTKVSKSPEKEDHPLLHGETNLCSHVKSQALGETLNGSGESLSSQEESGSFVKVEALQNTHHRSYVCELCPTDVTSTFKTKAELKRHKTLHVPQASSFSLQCSCCLEAFPTKAKLKQHVKVHSCTKTEEYSCQHCEKVFQKMSSLKSHLRIHSTEKPYSCDRCSAAFVRSCGLRRHERIHTREKRHKCELCPSAFHESSQLKAHNIKVHAASIEKPYSCSHCGAAFARSSTLQRHKKYVHTGEKRYKCELCPFAFHESTKLKNHMRVHTGEKPYKCSICSKAFSLPSLLKRHIASAHSSEGPFKCEVCPSTFTSSGDFNRHMRIHTGEKPYQCEYCAARFGERNYLRLHIRTHTGEKPYKCTFCAAAFSQQRNLKRHLSIHQGKKPCQCGVCSSTSSEATEHLESHSCEKPYRCEDCPAAFVTFTKLKNHMVCHTGQFKCGICGASFRTATGLTFHSHLHPPTS